MPTYLWQSDQGDEYEEELPMAKCPPLGSQKEINGVLFTRVVGHVMPAPVKDRYFVSHQLPRRWPHARQHAPDGKPVFTSMAEVRESVARSKDTPGDAVEYD